MRLPETNYYQLLFDEYYDDEYDDDDDDDYYYFGNSCNLGKIWVRYAKEITTYKQVAFDKIQTRMENISAQPKWNKAVDEEHERIVNVKVCKR